ncbi:ABC transporter substrate-binding protein [Candidatus Dependentiae bacterium]|nr:ABC transporter substrate-binding protein [Candidatus Dependentiae bacterium]
MQKTVQQFAITALVIGGFLGLMMVLKQRSSGGAAKTRWTIGILQTATHPALDDAKKGFMDVLQEKMGADVSFVVRNGEGSSTQMHAIAEHFRARPEIDAVYAIATPAVQAMTSVEKVKPIIIAAVTDPQQLGILTPTTNVCGTSDMIDVEQEIESMKLLLPTVKTVSVLYSPSEINATIVAEKMKELLSKKGMTPRLVPITTQADVVSAVSSALTKSDALLAPTDNLIASAITIIVDLARKAGKPLIVSDNKLVAHGALMAQGVNYYESGKESGRIAYQVLAQKKHPYEIPIAYGASKDIVINKQTLRELGLTLPPALLQSSTLIDTAAGK